jgi:hypothetical protein
MWLVKKAIELVYYYEADRKAGKPYWCDPAVVGLGVSLLGTALARWAGVNIDSDLQLKIVGAITGIGALASPHTGIVAKTSPTSPLPLSTHGEGEKPEEHNPAAMS